jgi:hypothetical protein
MAEPRKKKKKRKNGRPLEDVPMRTLVGRVKEELHGRILKLAAADSRKQKQD